LDIAVNNAGILRGTVPVGELSEEDWDAVLRTNLTGVWLAMKHEIAHMRANGGGAIVNIASNLGAHLRIPNFAAYIASKAAVSALTRAAALDHIHQGIRINAVSPGAAATSMSLRPGETEADRAERVKTENPLGRVAEAGEVAAAVLYLASHAAGAARRCHLPVGRGSAAWETAASASRRIHARPVRGAERREVTGRPRPMTGRSPHSDMAVTPSWQSGGHAFSGEHTQTHGGFGSGRPDPDGFLH